MPGRCKRNGMGSMKIYAGIGWNHVKVGLLEPRRTNSRSQRRGEKPGCEIGRDSWPEEGRSYGPKTDLQIIDWSGIGRNDCTRYHEGTV